MSNYEKMTVAFLDILGFSDKVMQSKDDDKEFINIISALTEIDVRKSVNQDYKNSIKEKRINITNFSDSIIVSAPSDNVGFWQVVLTVGEIFDAIVPHGVLLRGAITIGQHYHNEDVAFGPAVIEAYGLEQTACVDPRVILSRSALAAAQEFAKSGSWEKSYLFEYFQRDDDGIVYLDYFSDEKKSADLQDNDLSEYIQSKFVLIRENLLEGFSANVDKPRVFKKYMWMMAEYNNAVSLMKAQIPELRHLEIYEAGSGSIEIRKPYAHPSTKNR